MPDKVCKKEKHFYSTELSSHMEDYIETIAILAARNKVVRVKDIATELAIKMPSVTAALNKLKEQGLILYEKYGYIELTEQGKTIAEKVYDKHRLIADFLHSVLFIERHHASEEACRLEHHISPETCSQLSKILDFLTTEKNKGEQWYERFNTVMKRRMLINFAPDDVVTVIQSPHESKLPSYLQKDSRITILSTDNDKAVMHVSHNDEQHTVTFQEASAVFAKLTTD